MGLRYYKKEQGIIVRSVTMICVIILVLLGCYSLYRYIPPIDVSLPGNPPSFWGTSLTMIPFFDFSITIGMVICGILFILIILLIYVWILNKPKTADFLIDTEIELKKVSWPSKPQYTGSSIAVIVSVIILGSFLVIVDQILKLLMHLIKLR